MDTFREMFDKVRVKGHINLGGAHSLNSAMPVVYRGESDPNAPGSVPYYNSGGRAIIFDLDGTTYRVKGVDPSGLLTERVANSPKTKIGDVMLAKDILENQLAEGVSRDRLRMSGQKPFGVLSLERCEKEIHTFGMLARAYSYWGIENPCEFLSCASIGATPAAEKTYQLGFKLPRTEADLRLREFNALLTERLDQLTPAQIKAKSKDISDLFGRFIYWAGVNAAILSRFSLSPSKEALTSFRPQNWVFGRYGGGEGMFRIDHTLTRDLGENTAAATLTSEIEGTPYIISEFSRFPARVNVAANQSSYLPGKKEVKFSDVLYRRDLPADLDMQRAHSEAFHKGLICFGKPKLEPIPEGLIQEVLA